MWRTGHCGLCGLILCWGALASPSVAFGQRTLGPDLPPGYNQAQVHDPASPYYADYLPSRGPRAIPGRHYGPGSGYVIQPYPRWGGGYYDPYAPYNPGWGYADPWGYGPYPAVTSYQYFFGRPPIYTAQELWGPQLQGLWNPQGLGGVPAAPRITILARPTEQRAGNAVEKRPQVRASNAEALGRAWRWIDFGDRYFAKQEYRQAVQRYKEAANQAPDLPDAYLRQGLALAATGQYDLAATVIKRGVKLEPKLSELKWKLDDLYGGRDIAKSAHLESLAQAAENNVDDGDLLLLIALHLQLDGQGERAQPFFRRAAEQLRPGDPLLGRILNEWGAQ